MAAFANHGCGSTMMGFSHCGRHIAALRVPHSPDCFCSTADHIHARAAEPLDDISSDNLREHAFCAANNHADFDWMLGADRIVIGVSRALEFGLGLIKALRAATECRSFRRPRQHPVRHAS